MGKKIISIRRMLKPAVFFLIAAAIFAVPSFADPITIGSVNDFVLLALDNGTMSINSATSIIGDVGFSMGVTTLSAQKVDTFTGTAYVYSGSATTSFNATYAPATFAPSGGIQYGPGAVDTLLDTANTDAGSLQTQLDALFLAGPVTALTGNTNVAVNSSGTLNLYDVDWALNSNTLTINGGPDDYFVFRSTTAGNTWAQSQTILNGVDPNHVIFYFTSSSSSDAFLVNKDSTIFYGLIFAPLGSIEYHNPASFTGGIAAKSILVHSDFNIQHPGMVVLPEPSTLILLGSGLLAMASFARRRSKRR